ncbi:hypothetical protein [Amycolatopsis sp.]|jgi:hypothetical protein|uniref:hypothetical protein n=1 Tax=Amycolatopsis sp. TaxID=37632 RepID=UPI002DFE7DFE|nr:hypothetical protein [Amycolatopsis sp.]
MTLARTGESEGRESWQVHALADPPLARGGFTDLRRHPVEVPGAALEERGEEFW